MTTLGITGETVMGNAQVARGVDTIYSPPPFHWVGDGFRVRGYFSQDRALVGKLSPFLLLDYHAPYAYPPTANKRRGVGPHPHRGFETVTLAFEGSVAHHDSAGNGGVIGPGDVQWMTAAGGILHREYHEENFARAGGTMHMAQIWVNLPKANKMDPPRYQAIVKDEIPEVQLADGAGTVRIISGSFQGTNGAAKTHSPVQLWEVALAESGRFDIALPVTDNVSLLVMSGAVALPGGAYASTETAETAETAKAEELVVFDHQGERATVEAKEEARLLVMAGQPIDEPVVQYGPFVMNTEAEIRQAITDFNRGGFGHLEE